MSQWPTGAEPDNIYAAQHPGEPSPEVAGPSARSGDVAAVDPPGAPPYLPEPLTVSGRELRRARRERRQRSASDPATLRQRKLRRQALRRVVARILLWAHTGVYLGVSLLLWVIWFLTRPESGDATMHNPDGTLHRSVAWPAIVMAAWGIGLLMHAVVTFSTLRSGRAIERELARLEQANPPQALPASDPQPPDKP